MIFWNLTSYSDFRADTLFTNVITLMLFTLNIPRYFLDFAEPSFPKSLNRKVFDERYVVYQRNFGHVTEYQLSNYTFGYISINLKLDLCDKNNLQII